MGAGRNSNSLVIVSVNQGSKLDINRLLIGFFRFLQVVVGVLFEELRGKVWICWSSGGCNGVNLLMPIEALFLSEERHFVNLDGTTVRLVEKSVATLMNRLYDCSSSS